MFEEFMTAAEAVELSGLPKPLLFYHFHKGRFIGHWFGEALAIDRADFARFLSVYKKRERGGAAKKESAN